MCCGLADLVSIINLGGVTLSLLVDIVVMSSLTASTLGDCILREWVVSFPCCIGGAQDMLET